MHELSLIRSLLDIIDNYSIEHGFHKVNVLNLSFGRLSSIDPQALTFAFEIQSKATIAEGARLEFEILPAGVFCFDCEEEIRTETYRGCCPLCEGSQIILTGGMEELKLKEIDVD